MNFINNYKFEDKYFFRLGIFFLPSAPFLSVLFFLTTVIISFSKSKILILKDKYNRIFLFAFVGMLMISFLHFLKIDTIIFNQKN